MCSLTKIHFWSGSTFPLLVCDVRNKPTIWHSKTLLDPTHRSLFRAKEQPPASASLYFSTSVPSVCFPCCLLLSLGGSTASHVRSRNSKTFYLEFLKAENLFSRLPLATTCTSASSALSLRDPVLDTYLLHERASHRALQWVRAPEAQAGSALRAELTAGPRRGRGGTAPPASPTPR